MYRRWLIEIASDSAPNHAAPTMGTPYSTSDDAGYLPVKAYRNKKRPLGRSRNALRQRKVRRHRSHPPRAATSPMGATLLLLAVLALGAWLYIAPLGTGRRERIARGVLPPNRTVYASQTVNVRDQPDMHSLVRRTLRQGEAVFAAASDGQHWTQIFDASGGSIGWVHGAYLQDTPPAVHAGVSAPPATQPRPLATQALSAGADPRPVTAICRDGWQSHAEHHQGACAGHDGVRQFLR
jgi:uncharacterized protein YgiM (DUF1202 family)